MLRCTLWLLTHFTTLCFDSNVLFCSLFRFTFTRFFRFAVNVWFSVFRVFFFSLLPVQLPSSNTLFNMPFTLSVYCFCCEILASFDLLRLLFCYLRTSQLHVFFYFFWNALHFWNIFVLLTIFVSLWIFHLFHPTAIKFAKMKEKYWHSVFDSFRLRWRHG